MISESILIEKLNKLKTTYKKCYNDSENQFSKGAIDALNIVIEYLEVHEEKISKTSDDDDSCLDIVTIDSIVCSSTEINP